MPSVTPTTRVDLRGVTFSWSNGKGINDADDYPDEGAAEKDSMASDSAQTPEPLKVLIVSRDPQTPRMLEEILNREGVLVDVPQDTVAAWNQVKTGEVGLVVYDLTAPRLDDLVFFRTVRSSIKTLDIPFLFLLRSNYKLPDLIPEGGESVRDGWLTLPCPAQQFSILVQRMLQQMLRRWERGSKAQIASKTAALRRKQMEAASKAAAEVGKGGAPTQIDVEAPSAPPIGAAAQQAELAGRLEAIELPQILSLIEPMKLTGTLTVNDGKRAGTIYFVEGSVCHARMMDIEGADALFLLFHMKQGSFRFDRGEPVTIRTIQGNVTALLLEGMRQMDMAKEAIMQHQAKHGTTVKKKP